MKIVFVRSRCDRYWVRFPAMKDIWVNRWYLLRYGTLALAYLNGGGNFKTSNESRDDEHIRGGAMGGHSLDTIGHCSNLLGLPSSAVSLGFRNFVLEPYWTLSSVLASMTIKDPTESIVS